MKNLEIKAYCKDIKKVEEILRSVNVEFLSDGFQRDIYYNVPKGNLKIRETNDCGDFLIWYKRRKKSEPKLSEYYIYHLSESKELKKFLEIALGEKVIVEKIRKVFKYKNVRIHLDRVKGLGNFIELEAVLSENEMDRESKISLRFLIEKIGIKREDLIKNSYSEMFK